MTATFPLPPPVAQDPRANRGTGASQKPPHGVGAIPRLVGASGRYRPSSASLGSCCSVPPARGRSGSSAARRGRAPWGSCPPPTTREANRFCLRHGEAKGTSVLSRFLCVPRSLDIGIAFLHGAIDLLLQVPCRRHEGTCYVLGHLGHSLGRFDVAILRTLNRTRQEKCSPIAHISLVQHG